MRKHELPSTYLVVTLLALMVQGEQVPAETILEVDRPTRNDWIGSKLARDATDEEIAAYRADQAEDDGLDEHLAEDRRQLLDEIKQLAAKKATLGGDVERLQERKVELAGDLKALESDLEEFGKRRDALTAEVAELEKAKAAAEKPVTPAKSK